MFLSLVFFVTGLLGFLTFTVVMTQYKSNRKVNFYLLILFFFIALRFFLWGIYNLMPFSVDEEIACVFRAFGTVVFPCMYLYFRNLISNRKNAALADWRYFIIPVVFGFSSILIRKYAPYLQFYLYFLFLLIPLYYLFLSYVELKNKVWFKKSKVLIVDRQKLLIRNWTCFFFTVCLLFVIRLEVSLLFDVFVAGFSHGTSYLWISAIISCVLFFRILLTDEVLFVTHKNLNKEERKDNFELVFDDLWIISNDMAIDNIKDLQLKERVESNLSAYIRKVEIMALEHFCFRNPSVSMRDFAINLGIPKSHLLYLFKYHSGVNFIEFKKTVRVYDAISLIESGYLNLNTVESLSEKAGFSSCSAFLIIFKEITDVDPHDYNAIVKKI